MLWHYTVGVRYDDIWVEGVIKPATAHVPEYEDPVVWFTERDSWEPTANKGAMKDGEYRSLSREETAERGGGLYRIGVAEEVAPYDWSEFVSRSGVDGQLAAALARRAREVGSDPRRWHVSFDPVVRCEWETVEVRRGDGWVPEPRWKERSRDR